jgi:hypothetical protein
MTGGYMPGRNEEELTMAGKSFSEDFGKEMTGKAIMWGPAIVGTALLGAPVGIVAGLIASVVLVVSGNSTSPPPTGEQDAGDRK